MRIPSAAYCRFLDHSLDNPSDSQPIICEVFGILAKEDDKALYIHSWVSNRSLSNDNNEVYCILKSTIEELTELKKTFERRKRPENRQRRGASAQAKCVSRRTK